MKQIEPYQENETEADNTVYKALSSVYKGIYLIDLENDRYTIVHSPEKIISLLDGIPSAQEAINRAVKKTVSRDGIIDMLTFVNFLTLPERMASQNCLSTDYKGKISGWVKGNFIEVKRDAAGRLTQVLYAYQVIDEEKKKTIANVQILETDKRELADDLKYHSDFNKVVLEQMKCGVLAYTIPGRTLLQINREALRIYGWKNAKQAAENLSKRLEYIKLANPKDAQKLFRLREQEDSVKYQFIVNEGKPDERHVLAESKSLAGRYDGKIIITTFVDITHVAALEKEQITLRDKNVFLSNENAELQRARDAVYSILNSGSYLCTYAEDGESLLSIKYSDALRTLYGYTDEQDAPNTWDLWLKSVYPDDRDYVMNHYLTALRDYTGKTKYSVAYRALRKDGTVRWHRAAGHVIRRENGTTEFCYGFIMDIDEQKKSADMLEEALQQARLANEAKTSFLARMSHDIRTPMNGIMGLIDINEKHADDVAFTTQNRRKAKVAANHLLSLINDVLQLSKLEDTNTELAEVPFYMPALLKDIYTITEMRAKENGIIIEQKTDDNIQKYPYLWGSPLHIRQIYINLLGNSIKYNKQNGSILCSVSAEKTDAEHILSKVVIKDTGIGMSEEFLQHLFDPFSREHEETTGNYEGTGLGLSIVKQLIDKMGGTIQVESTVGEGSCFTVEIPFRLASEADAARTQEEKELGDIVGKHILLVEDNELNMDISEIILTDAGAHITKAMNGQQAVDIFAENQPETFDMILMDVMMPVMNGYEATRCIRALERPDAKTIPIIAMTANAFVEDVEKAKQAGMNAHLAKPLDVRKMLAVMTKYL